MCALFHSNYASVKQNILWKKGFLKQMTEIQHMYNWSLQRRKGVMEQDNY